jgi:hypothetical protein
MKKSARREYKKPSIERLGAVHEALATVISLVN